MSTFDPDKPAYLHDRLNEEVLEWRPEDAQRWREHAVPHVEGVITWDGLLIDGWRAR